MSLRKTYEANKDNLNTNLVIEELTNLGAKMRWERG